MIHNPLQGKHLLYNKLGNITINYTLANINFKKVLKIDEVLQIILSECVYFLSSLRGNYLHNNDKKNR